MTFIIHYEHKQSNLLKRSKKINKKRKKHFYSQINNKLEFLANVTNNVSVQNTINYAQQ